MTSKKGKTKPKSTPSINTIIDVAVYGEQVMFHFGDIELLEERLRETCGKGVVEQAIQYLKEKIASGYNYTGHTLDLINGVLVYLYHIPQTPDDYGVLAHEIAHAVFRLTQKVGIEYSSASEEAYTYLTEFLTRKVLSVLSE